MQRSISHQKSLVPFGYVALFVLYSSLSTMYLFLPPLFSVLYILFARTLEEQNPLHTFLIFLCLIIFEVNFGYILFSSIAFFYLLKKVIMPKIEKNFSCRWCIRLSLVTLVYVGYFLFLSLIGSIFMLSVPHLSYYIIYYIIIEFFIVSLL
jgi:hypothetical protein